jgi:hypothetical protein
VNGVGKTARDPEISLKDLMIILDRKLSSHFGPTPIFHCEHLGTPWDPDQGLREEIKKLQLIVSAQRKALFRSFYSANYSDCLGTCHVCCPKARETRNIINPFFDDFKQEEFPVRYQDPEVFVTFYNMLSSWEQE